MLAEVGLSAATEPDGSCRHGYRIVNEPIIAPANGQPFSAVETAPPLAE